MLFPNGIAHYILGGVLIGLGVSVIYLLTGYIAGASGFLTAAQSWWSKSRIFQTPAIRSGRVWKGVLVLGLVLGAALYTALWGAVFTTEVQLWRLALGGFLVGFGVRLSKGCTSGHGVCGLSSWSLPSLVAVCTFMAVAILTALFVSYLGVTP